MSYEVDYDNCCPKCGNDFLHYRDCDSLNCDEGMGDYHFDDPINIPIEGEEHFICPECNGTGVNYWCPKCGADIK